MRGIRPFKDTLQLINNGGKEKTFELGEKKLEEKSIDILEKNNKAFYISYFSNIFEKLYDNEKKTIAVVLDENNLLEEQEKLLNFVKDNKEEFLKTEYGKLIYNIVLGFSEDIYDKTFEEVINRKYLKTKDNYNSIIVYNIGNQNIGFSTLILLPSFFSNLLNKNNNFKTSI